MVLQLEGHPEAVDSLAGTSSRGAHQAEATMLVQPSWEGAYGVDTRINDRHPNQR